MSFVFAGLLLRAPTILALQAPAVLPLRAPTRMVLREPAVLALRPSADLEQSATSSSAFLPSTATEALASSSLSPAAAFADVWVRYFYHGGTARRDGVLLHLGRRFNAKELVGSEVLELLSSHVELERHEPRVYSNALEGWAPMQADTTFPLSADAGDVHRVDVQLFARTRVDVTQDDGPELEGKGVRAGRAAEPEGYFLCGAVGIKTRENLGTLFRSAYQLGAAGLFVIGDRLDQPSGRRGNSPPPSSQPASENSVSGDGGGGGGGDGGDGGGEAPSKREVKSFLCQVVHPLPLAPSLCASPARSVLQPKRPQLV